MVTSWCPNATSCLKMTSSRLPTTKPLVALAALGSGAFGMSCGLVVTFDI